MRRLYILLIFLLSACQPASLQTDQPALGFSLYIHPDGRLYVGDQVSFEVLPPPGWVSQDRQVQVSLADQVLGSTGFAPYGVGQRNQATLWWTWDTRHLQQGEYTLSFSILPAGPEWQQTVQLQSASINPYQNRTWASTTSACCTISYITATDSERDIQMLTRLVDEQAQDVSALLQTDFNQPISITFMPRLVGQGGFTINGIYISYLDQNYAGNTTAQVIHHEMVHILDASLGGELRPSIFVEGLAVYLSGGHFKSEALLPRAAAILELDQYIPLQKLVEDFYNQQHEIGYLEAGALVEYMVARYGWEKYENFYRHIPTLGSQADSLESALQQHFGITLNQLELDFLDELQAQVVSIAERDDLRLTIAFYDSLRRYQQVLDPSAYFLTAWLPDGQTMRQKGIVADFLRAPNRVDNQFFEYLLLNANRDLSAGDFEQADRLLGGINFLLDFYPK
jgi:hypothetical protein